jgi:hypothetical protein
VKIESQALETPTDPHPPEDEGDQTLHEGIGRPATSRRPPVTPTVPILTGLEPGTEREQRPQSCGLTDSPEAAPVLVRFIHP